MSENVHRKYRNISWSRQCGTISFQRHRAVVFDFRNDLCRRSMLRYDKRHDAVSCVKVDFYNDKTVCITLKNYWYDIKNILYITHISLSLSFNSFFRRMI